MASVMVVDDSIAVRLRVGRALTDAGFEIVEAADGVDALEKLAASSVSLIICDVNMPRMNGLDLIEELTRRGTVPPFLMLTTEGRMELIQQAKKLGAKAWMFKPFDIEHLVLAVRKLVG